MNAHDKDNLDRWLNTALAQRGSAEPRAGLEGRILANLAVETSRASTGRPLRWAFSLATIALVLAAWFGLRVLSTRSHQTTDEAVNQPSAVSHKSGPVTLPKTATMRLPKRSQSRQDAKQATLVERSAPSRLNQFPSPRPLSPQELLFASYAQRFPQEAILIAQEQKKFEEEVRQAERRLQQSSPASDQER